MRAQPLYQSPRQIAKDTMTCSTTTTSRSWQKQGQVRNNTRTIGERQATLLISMQQQDWKPPLYTPRAMYRNRWNNWSLSILYILKTEEIYKEVNLPWSALVNIRNFRPVDFFPRWTKSKARLAIVGLQNN